MWVKKESGLAILAQESLKEMTLRAMLKAYFLGDSQ